MDSINESFDDLLNEVDAFVDEMLIKETSNTLNLDTIYSLYRRWCAAHDKNHADHYDFKRRITKDIGFVGRTPYVTGLKINTEKVKDLKVIERKKIRR